MKRRVSIPIILAIVYSAVFLIFYFVLPYLFHRTYSIGGFFPFFFFFPFVFGRGRRRGYNQNSNRNGTSGQNNPDDILSEQYDSKEWERMKTQNYDEYGIRTKNSLSRYWYYVGVLVIIVTTIILFMVKEGYLPL